jgi:hypothetical protein
MSQTEVFPASVDARRAISRRAYILFGVGVALLMCGASVIGISFASSGSPPSFLVGIAGAVSCAGVAGFIIGIVTLSRMRQLIQVEVSPHRIIWREGGKVATTEIGDIVRVELVKDYEQKRGGFTMAFPVIRFIETSGEMMEFEVTFEDRGFVHHSRFDARAIAREVMRYLPQHVVTSPTLGEFLRSGEVDIDLLPER